MKISLSLILVHFLILSSLKAQESDERDFTGQPGTALFMEILGKGYYSANADFRITDHQRFSIGITSLDYDVVNESAPDETEPDNYPSPGVMYYYLAGHNRSRLELGAGISTSPLLNKTYHSEFHSDHPLSLHGVIGYRYQKKNGLLFRAGFTPFFRPRVWILPLAGLSLGYSW